jgi:hypothetical protein
VNTSRTPEEGALSPSWPNGIITIIIIIIIIIIITPTACPNVMSRLLNDRGVCENIRDWCEYVSHPWRGRPQPKLAKRDYYHHHHPYYSSSFSSALLLSVSLSPQRPPKSPVVKPSLSEKKPLYCFSPPYLRGRPQPKLAKWAHYHYRHHHHHHHYLLLVIVLFIVVTVIILIGAVALLICP